MSWKTKTVRRREKSAALRAILRPEDRYVVQAAGWWLGMLVNRQRVPSSDWSLRQAMLKRKISHMATQLGLDAEKVAKCLSEVTS